MSGAALLLAEIVIFLCVAAAIVAATIAAMLFAGRALNRARSAPARLRAAALSLLALCAIAASAAAGFWTLGALLYFANHD